ncbi:hypothetical protein P43SY_001208 [Pythium insidiosum]|uniref:Uncharacterized protein n=1 Tax=Pythium insidiosum TaxID=114742 RepID=A0AAD5QCR7_PYTIN|nr:hypothetical protein P43SY_001208 [Pythium insidiosum]
MSESKHAPSDCMDEDFLRSLPVVDVQNIDISPNPAQLTDELNLEVDFRLDKPVANGVWDIQLGQVEAQNYRKGDNHFQFSVRVSPIAVARLVLMIRMILSAQVPQIDVADIQPSHLTNCGLLIASLKGDEGDIVDIKMVVQVSEHRGGFQRIIYNPLE